MAGSTICRQSPKVGAGWFNDHVRICPGGAGQPASLPRSTLGVSKNADGGSLTLPVSNGHKPYLIAVEEAFGGDVDYAMIIKEYGNPADDDGSKQAHRRYSPGIVNGVEKIVVVVSQPGPDQHQLRGAEQPDAADEHAALHQADERLLEEAGPPRADGLGLPRLLQLVSAPQDAGQDPPDTGDGGRADRPGMEAGGPGANRRRADAAAEEARAEAEVC